MKRVAKGFLVCSTIVWVFLCLTERPVPVFALLQGSFFSTAVFLGVLVWAMGLRGAAFAFGFCAGVTAASLSGPLLHFVPLDWAYGIAALICGTALIASGFQGFALIWAAGIHLWSLTSLSRFQMGLGGALIDTRPEYFLPAFSTWIMHNAEM